MLRQGYIHLYTGDGKGKTTAALGLAFRASGRALKTYIAQFMKGQSYGELKAIKENPYITVVQFGQDTFVHIDKAVQEDIALAEQGLLSAEQAMLSNNYDIIILDEINVAIYFKLLTIERIIEFIQLKPQHIELVLTGRKASPQLIELADLVTEMKEIKHYYQKGVPARDGIER
jgi:cob(I)alamin adenosyltransferase